MGEKEEHRYFDKDSKYEAIRLMNESNRSVKEIAADLGIHLNLFHQWRRTCIRRAAHGEAKRRR